MTDHELHPFTCPCCGATSYHPKDAEYGWCSRCHAFTGDPELSSPHMAGACPERKATMTMLYPFEPDWTLAEILIDRHLSTEQAGSLTGLRPEEIEGVITGRTVVGERIAERLAKLGPSARYWLNYQAGYDADIARGAKDVSGDYREGAGDGTA